MTPQQIHEWCIAQLRTMDEVEAKSGESLPAFRAYFNRENDKAVAAFYGLTVEQLNLKYQAEG